MPACGIGPDTVAGGLHTVDPSTGQIGDKRSDFTLGLALDDYC